MSQPNRHVPVVGMVGLVLAAIACTCGPLSQVSDAAATIQAAEGTIGAVATQGATFEAMATQTLGALTFEAPDVNATMTALFDTEQINPTSAAPTSVPGQSGEEYRQWAAAATARSEYSNPSWAASQAAGAPNTTGCGDIETAWASSSGTGVDWLQLDYSTGVIPTSIEIHETYNPGAIERIEVVDLQGVQHVIYDVDPEIVEECPRTLVVPVEQMEFPINQVIIYLDQTNHPGWNEIDAVELIGVLP